MTGPINDDHARYHNVDPDTSVEAAARLTTGRSDQIAILLAHCRAVMGGDLIHGPYRGLADFESGELTGIDHWNARKRCHELREAGLLRFNGEVRNNPESNRPNAVSVLTAAGAEEYFRHYPVPRGGPLADLIAEELHGKEGQALLW